MGDLLPNGRERTGIVEERQALRLAYATYIDRKVETAINEVTIERMVTKAVDERVKAEVDAIMARRAAELAADMDALYPGPRVNIRDILKAVEAATGCSVGDLVGPRKSYQYVKPRHFAFWLVRRLRADLSFPTIGQAFGGRDHATIANGVERFQAARDRYREWLEHPAILALESQP